MNWVLISKLPIVMQIIANAEKSIQKATGQQASLHLGYSADMDVNEKERTKLLLQELICINYNESWEDIRKKGRYENLNNARQAYMYLACEVLKQTPAETGKDVNRDRGTVSHAIGVITGYYSVKDPLIITIEKVKQKFIRL